MTVQNDITNVAANFKQQFADKMTNLIPDNARLVKDVRFVAKSKMPGGAYRHPVIVRGENGFTYAAPDSGNFALNDASTLLTQDAQVLGNNLILVTDLSYEAVQRAARSNQAFEEDVGLRTENMLEALVNRTEISCLYGRSGIGTVGVAGDSAVGATTITFQFTEVTWATGIWAGSEGAQVQFEDSTGALISSGADSIFTVGVVDAPNRKVTFTGTATGVTAVETSNDSLATTAFFYGSRGTADMAGLDKIIRNVSSLFNIDAATYGLWRGNVHTVSGKLTIQKILRGVALACGKGLNENVTVYVNPDVWSDLAGDAASMRKFDSSYRPSKAEQGNETLVYYGQNGRVDVVSHPCVKGGDCFIVPLDRLLRIGATDITFQTPGMPEENPFFLHMPSNAGFQLRGYSNQAIFAEKPAFCTLVTGFTPSASA